MEALFSRYSLHDVLRWQEQDGLKQLIESFDSNRLLNTPLQDLVEYFVEKLRYEPLQILIDQIYVDQRETKIDVSQDFNRHISDRSRPFYLDGTQITYYVPYQGHQNLLYSYPSHTSSSRPRAKITETELQFTFDSLDHNIEAVKSAFDRQFNDLKQYLKWSEEEVVYFNSQLPQKVQQFIEMRRQKLLNDQGMVAALGFPLKKRQDVSTTFAAPVNRKKIITLPPNTTTPFTPEPVLELGAYEQILSIISNMVLVIERSPSAFRDMKEEDLRQHFLVQLNGQYEGQATGETFNYQGKTDILIRVNNKNIFIAECKFWKGEKILQETVTQLLGYTSWRDTKTAVLIFNRNKNFGEVVKAISPVMKQHPNFKREEACNGETNSRYVFRHINDPERELIITVMAFDIPGNQ